MAISYFSTSLIGLNAGVLLQRPTFVLVLALALMAIYYFMGNSLGTVTRFFLHILFLFWSAVVGSLFSGNIMELNNSDPLNKPNRQIISVTARTPQEIAQVVVIGAIIVASTVTFEFYGMPLGLIYTGVLVAISCALFYFMMLSQTGDRKGASAEDVDAALFPTKTSLLTFTLWWFLGLNAVYHGAQFLLNWSALAPLEEFWTQVIALGGVSLVDLAAFVIIQKPWNWSAKLKRTLSKKQAKARASSEPLSGDN
jgi:hypothetical protein